MNDETHRAAELRARALDTLGALDTLPPQELQRTTRLAAALARTGTRLPSSTVHLLDATSQHRVAASGGIRRERSPVESTLCVHVVEDGRAIYTPDAGAEPRFDGSPHTSGPAPVGLYYGTPLRLSNGTTVGTLCVFDDRPGTLTRDQRDRLDDLAAQTSAHLELSGAVQDLARVATRDPLTGVANRLKRSAALAAAFAAPDRAPHEPSLLAVDLDDFKQVNHRYGHDVGDQVLAGTAARLCAAVRARDLVGRLGGDRFVVLLDDLPDLGLLGELAARITAVTGEPYRTTAGPVRCTVSVGTAVGRHGDLAYELLGRADEHLYERKRVPR